MKTDILEEKLEDLAPKNYGLDIEREKAEVSNEDWVFGAISQPSIVYIPEDEREEYLPL